MTRLEIINKHRIQNDYPPFAINTLTDAEMRHHERLINEHAPYGDDPWANEPNTTAIFRADVYIVPAGTRDISRERHKIAATFWAYNKDEVGPAVESACVYTDRKAPDNCYFNVLTKDL